MSTIQDIAKLGQSIWLDCMSRHLLSSGKLQWYIQNGVRGVILNPFIWEHTLKETSDYDAQIHQLIEAGQSLPQIYEALLVQDVQQMADLLLPLFEKTDGVHGYVAVSATPYQQPDEGTAFQAIQRIQRAINRPNLLFKVPATPEGAHLLQQLTQAGICTLADMIFSPEQHQRMLEAFVQGLEQRQASGQPVSKVRSMAAVYIAPLDQPGIAENRIGVAFAKTLYQSFQDFLDSERWLKLEAEDAVPQHLAWSHTLPLDTSLPPTYYLDRLIGAHTIHVAQQSALEAFFKRGKQDIPAATLEEDVSEAREQLAGANIEEAGTTAQKIYLEQWLKAHAGVMEQIEQKRDNFLLSRSAAVGK